MKRLIISAFAAVALLTAATTILWSHAPSVDRTVGFAGMASLQSPNTATEANKLPVEEYEDMSVVYSAPPKH